MAAEPKDYGDLHEILKMLQNDIAENGDSTDAEPVQHESLQAQASVPHPTTIPTPSAEPTTQPAEPTTQPAEPATQPVELTTQPVERSDTSAGPSATPAESLTMSAEPTSTPAEQPTSPSLPQPESEPIPWESQNLAIDRKDDASEQDEIGEWLDELFSETETVKAAKAVGSVTGDGARRMEENKTYAAAVGTNGDMLHELQDEKKHGAARIIARIFVAMLTLCVIAGVYFFAIFGEITNGQSPTARDLFVRRCEQSPLTQWIPGVFLPDETIRDILSEDGEVQADA